MIIPRLIISISGNGEIKTLLLGKGDKREKLLRGYEKFIEANIPKIKGSVKSFLEERK